MELIPSALVKEFAAMRNSLVAATMLFLCVNAYAKCEYPAQDLTNSSAEQEVWAALCDIDKGDYATAQRRVETVLQADANNIYAQKLWPGTLAAQIKPKDKSPENIALVRKTIEAYQRVLRNLQLSAEEKLRVDQYVLSRYRMISEEERTNELLKRVAAANRPPIDRSEWYGVLATDSYLCAEGITSQMEEPDKSELAKANECVKKGLEYANQAITLNANNFDGWSYKGQLLNQAAILAERANNQRKKALYKTQSAAAEKRAYKLFAQRRARDLNAVAPTPTPTVSKEDLAKELTEYKAENPLAKLVRQIYIPAEQTFESLLHNNKEKIRQAREDREKEQTAKLQEKHDWKNFAPADEELTAELPDNVRAIDGDAHRYEASSESVSYLIFSWSRQAVHTNSSQDSDVLNVFAWDHVNTMNHWLDSSTARAFEIRLLRKGVASGQPSRAYSFADISCSGKTQGTMIVYAGKTRYYQVLIAGADESDPRVQHFLNSIKFK